MISPKEENERVAVHAARFIERLIHRWERNASELSRLLQDPALNEQTRKAWELEIANTPARVGQARELVVRLRCGEITKAQAFAVLFGGD